MKRTERLDREREIALPTVSPKTFTTVGDILLTPEEKAEKRDKQLKGKHFGVAQTLVDGIKDEVNLWARQVVLSIAPQSVIQNGTIGDWASENVRVVRDGLRWVMLKDDREVSHLSMQNMPLRVQPEVLRLLEEAEA